MSTINRELKIGFGAIFRTFRRRIAKTWGIVLVENVLLALIPLLIGFSIDGPLAGRLDELAMLGGVLALLGVIGVARRIYDTRVYGTIRVHLGFSLHHRNTGLRVSARNARLGMSRELVDFLEKDVPELITAIVQVIISLTVLAVFDPRLGLASAIVLVAMIGFYACFHGSFYRFAANMNERHERQVDVLDGGSKLGVFRHLRGLRGIEVSVSDTEAYLYGGMFLMQIAFVIFNLYVGAQLPAVTAGMIFSIATYSWEYVDAALRLPMALQSWSRLSEITKRINQPT
ncbi:MAG: ABC transporter six-transmembrane domain-containing protein [Pseudomonadota bacterium]